MSPRIYAAIDLKSFYASVECMERGLDPMKTNLVVADASRTEKTICLAVSPSLKSYGISGRPRLFEVVQKVREINAMRKGCAPRQMFCGSSCNFDELSTDSSLALDYITAPPQMARYIQYSTRIYSVYLKYVAPEDIHVYSIDEVFLDLTDYLPLYRQTARELIMKMILDVLSETGITATAGIGTNLYLAKVAMDIGAKRIPPDENGVRIAELDELSYRQMLWSHRPLTDFWRIGRGYARKLEANGLYTMGDVARCSIGQSGEFHNEALLYKLFGVNAELLIDHAWGWESCTIADIKAYRPESSSTGTGQVLSCGYAAQQARTVIKEMADQLALDLVEKGLVTDQVVLTIGYDIENLKDPQRLRSYHGDISIDHYGRPIPKHAHGSVNLGPYTASAKRILEASAELYDRIIDSNLLVKRIYITANHVLPESSVQALPVMEQLTIFSDTQTADHQSAKEQDRLRREKQMQKAVLTIRKKYGKNAILKGMNFTEGATAKERNMQIGGHKA